MFSMNLGKLKEIFGIDEIILKGAEQYLRTFYQLWETNHIFREEHIKHFNMIGLNISANIPQMELYIIIVSATIAELFGIPEKDSIFTRYDPNYVFNKFQVRDGKLHIKQPYRTHFQLSKTTVQNDKFELMCHPELFTDGKGGLNSIPRGSKKRTIYHLRNLMQSALLIFQIDYDYIFISYERYIIFQALGSYMKYRSKDPDDVTVREFMKTLNFSSNTVIERSGSFIGTGASYRSNTMNLVAMCAAYGEPNVFVTMSFSEMSMPNRDKLLDPSYFISQLPYSMLNTAQSTIRVICKHILGIDPSGDTLFGKSDHFFIRNEFQNRGQVHVHLLL